MKLLLLARYPRAFSEWSEHLAPLSEAGWEVVFALQHWREGPGSAELRARLEVDPAWSLEPAPIALPRLGRIAGLVANRGGRMKKLAYAALSATPGLEEALREMAPDAVAVLGDDKAAVVFAPVLVAAAGQKRPRVLLQGWGPGPVVRDLRGFTDVAITDSRGMKRRGGCNVHTAGPLVSPLPETDDLGSERTRFLREVGLEPDTPYLLYLRSSERPKSLTDPLPEVLRIAGAAGLQVAVLPGAHGAKTASQIPSETPPDSATWALINQGELRPSAASTKRLYRLLAGGAHLILGEETPRLLDAAAAGLPVAALPHTQDYIAASGQTDRFGPQLLNKIDHLPKLLKSPARAAPVEPTVPLAEVLKKAKARRPDPLHRVAVRVGLRLAPGRLEREELPEELGPAVVRTLDRSEDINLSESEVSRTLETLAAGTSPILVGPWISEVGFEVLYWIPFVRWCVRRFGIDTRRLVVCSRGGVESWYADLRPGGYFDVFDLMDEATFRDMTMARFAASGGQKHMELGELDDIAGEEARRRTGSNQVAWLHPQLMYRFYRSYWQGRLGHLFFDQHSLPGRFQPDNQPILDAVLPEKFVAVRFYFRPSFEDTPENRSFVTRLVTRLSQRWPVVLMDTGLKLDDHDEFAPLVEGNVQRIGHLITGRNNLAIQSEVVRRAQMFVGTYGGLSYVPAFHGVPAIAVSSDVAGFHAVHLQAAVRVFHRMGQSFTHTMRDELDTLLG
ncbi:hypothetical protein AY599_03270 [Leptolyngbya valderiana BDU 20041]|nr:hypothetical protein AY599_03270 [Leptolyngbya valderiana BDU 20041]